MSKFYIFILFITLSFLSCGKQDTSKIDKIVSKKDFVWSENISLEMIPDIPLKGMMNGKEINFEYINYEMWRGSGDNVINFGNKKPSQVCGYVENDNSFHLTRKGTGFQKGEFIKENFNSTIDGVTADYHYFTGNDIVKLNPPWNCALIIKELSDKYVKGKIAICFKDDAKSWIAGEFEALICNN